MRGRSYVKRFAAGAAAMLFLLFAFSFAAAERFVGLDVNADLDCEPGDFDMGRTFGAGEIGTQVTVNVFYDDCPPFYGYGCTFCVTEGSLVGTALWTSNHPAAGWTQFTTFASDTGTFPIEVSPWITSAYPNYKCWLVQGIDWNLQSGGVPYEAFPAKVGSLTFNVAAEGAILWVIDGDATSVLSSSALESLPFSEEGMTCSYPAATEPASWGSVKQLFR
ncbi:MAG: hypothetical protein FJY73_04805 [Candidatus Eisenbacteria bacterium]|nr:hypothetical protein [Candidatus Eisenbacteria bacterium]